jgi:hypothetical protein
MKCLKILSQFGGRKKPIFHHFSIPCGPRSTSPRLVIDSFYSVAPTSTLTQCAISKQCQSNFVTREAIYNSVALVHERTIPTEWEANYTHAILESVSRYRLQNVFSHRTQQTYRARKTDTSHPTFLPHQTWHLLYTS